MPSIAHNCKVELTGNIQACTSSEATERSKDIPKTTIGESTDTYAFTGINNQTFWLLSVDELKYLNGGAECTTAGKYTTLIANDLSSGSATSWCDGGYDITAFFVSDYGFVNNRGVDYRYGVRAAFQITI